MASDPRQPGPNTRISNWRGAVSGVYTPVHAAGSQGQQVMKDFREQARVTAFLRNALAEAPQGVLKLEAMARREALLGEHQRITHTKAFKRAKHSLRIRSVRAGFGTNRLALGIALRS